MLQPCGAFAMRSRALPVHNMIRTKYNCTLLAFSLSRHRIVAHSIRTAFRSRHVRRQSLIGGSCVSFHHEAPVGPCLLAAVRFVQPPEYTSIHHLSSCCTRSSALLERLVQLCNPGLSFDRRTLGASTRIQLFRRCLFQDLQSLEHLRCLLCIHGFPLSQHEEPPKETTTKLLRYHDTYICCFCATKFWNKRLKEIIMSVRCEVLKACYMQQY